jgi:hypothetical protein
MLLFTPPAKMPGWVVILSVGFTRGTTMASKLLLLGAFMVQLTIEFDFVSTSKCKQTGRMFRIVFFLGGFGLMYFQYLMIIKNITTESCNFVSSLDLF